MMTAEAGSTREAGDQLAALIAEGRHREAVSACARAYGPLLGRFCMGLLGAQVEAEEALQETLIGAYRGMSSYRGDGSPRSWLLGIARRQCARRLERRHGQRERQLELVREADVHEPASGLPDQQLRERRRAASVARALGLLKPTQREALLLRYQAQLSYGEVGAAIGVQEVTARKRVSRALESLRQLLRAEELE